MRHQVSKEIVVTALIFDKDDRFLIVKPEYKEGWILPGGYVEVGESPSDACRREILAEIGVEINRPNRLLSVDYRGSFEEYIMFIFYGGVFTDDTIKSIKLPPSLLEYRFVTKDEALKLLRPKGIRRLIPTLDSHNKTVITYLENQEPF